LSLDQSISFHSESISFKLNQAEEIAQWLKLQATAHHIEIRNLEYIFCSDSYLLEINKKYLNHDFYTDIITFPLQEDPLEGTIFISVERVKENAQLYNVTTVNELHRVVAHGLLHLIGYKDKTEDEKKEMRTKENEWLDSRDFL